MKKVYQIPQATLVSLSLDDVIRTSTLTGGDSGDGLSNTWDAGKQ